MKSIWKLCCILCLVTLFMTGCGTSSTNQTTSTQTKTQSSTNTVKNNSGSVSGSVFQTALPILSITGTPVKSSGLFVYNSNIYYISPVNNEIVCVSANTAVQYPNNNASTTSNIGKLQYINELPSEMLYSNNLVYYTNRADNNKIYSLDLKGQNKKKLVDESAHNMIMMGNYIYYINNENKLKIFDSGSGTTYSLQINAICFDSDGTNIYYEASNSDGTYSLDSAKVDGTGVQILSNDSTSSLTVNNGNIFYINGSDGHTLYYMTTDGKTKARFTDIQAGNLQYANGYIYYCDDFGKLYKIKTDGSSNTQIITDPSMSSFIIDNGTIYYTRDISTEEVVYKTAG